MSYTGLYPQMLLLLLHFLHRMLRACSCLLQACCRVGVRVRVSVSVGVGVRMKVKVRVRVRVNVCVRERVAVRVRVKNMCAEVIRLSVSKVANCRLRQLQGIMSRMWIDIFFQAVSIRSFARVNRNSKTLTLVQSRLERICTIKSLIL